MTAPHGAIIRAREQAVSRGARAADSTEAAACLSVEPCSITSSTPSAGTVIISVRATTDGRRLLRRARKGLRIAVRHEFRDILAATATGLTKGRLR